MSTVSREENGLIPLGEQCAMHVTKEAIPGSVKGPGTESSYTGPAAGKGFA